MGRFRTTFTLNDHPVRHRTVRTEEAVAAVQECIEEDPNQSIGLVLNNCGCDFPHFGRFNEKILV